MTEQQRPEPGEQRNQQDEQDQQKRQGPQGRRNGTQQEQERRPSTLFGLLPLPERTFVADALRAETVGGMLLLLAAVVSLVWANAAPGSYEDVGDHHVGPSILGLHLSITHWTSEGLLAVFFFVAAVELKRELVVGELREPARAILPVIAAVCGMAVPGALYVLISAVGGGALSGWAVPMTTDIAFALAVLAVIGTALPSALRAFLLTLAVVDDILAILIIAIFYSADLNFAALGGAVACLVLFWLLLRVGVRGWYVYVPLGLVVWGLTYNSGLHATIAGVALGLIPRVTPRPGEQEGPGERIEHLVRPVSAGLAVPLFALFAAGVTLSGSTLGDVFQEPETLGVMLGLMVGKTIGVFGGTYLAARFTRARLNPDLDWPDVFALAALSGIGFTVSLLLGELAFDKEPSFIVRVKASVLVGSLIAAALSGILLRVRNNKYRDLTADEERDEDEDGIPDIYERDTPAYHLRMAEILERKAAEHRRLARQGGNTGGPDGI